MISSTQPSSARVCAWSAVTTLDPASVRFVVAESGTATGAGAGGTYEFGNVQPPFAVQPWTRSHSAFAFVQIDASVVKLTPSGSGGPA